MLHLHCSIRFGASEAEEGNASALLFHTFLSSLDLCFNGQGLPRCGCRHNFWQTTTSCFWRSPGCRSLNPHVQPEPEPEPACHSRSTMPTSLPQLLAHCREQRCRPHPTLWYNNALSLDWYSCVNSDLPFQTDVVLERPAWLPPLSKSNLFCKLCDGVKVTWQSGPASLTFVCINSNYHAAEGPSFSSCVSLQKSFMKRSFIKVLRFDFAK